MSVPTDEELIARMQSALDDLTSNVPAGRPALEDRAYTVDLLERRRRRWPVLVAVAAVAAAGAVGAVVVGGQDDDRHPATPAVSSPPDSGAPVSQPVPPTTIASLPSVAVTAPGASEEEQPTTVTGAAPELPPTRIYAGDGIASDRVLVVRTTDAEFDAPYPEGDHTMDPVSAPTGEAWVLHPVLDEPGNRVPVGPAVVWWSTGNGRELVSVTGRGFSDAELAALLPALTFDGVAWGWPGATASGMAEVPAQHHDQWQQYSSVTTLADGARVAIVVTTGSRWDLLEQSSLYPLVTGRAARVVLPDGTNAVVMADPGSYQVYWQQGGAVVHVSVPLSEDLDAVLAAVVVTP
jgi:hypothetical protein